MHGGQQWLLLVCEVIGVAAALLVLPCALIDFAFDTKLGEHLVARRAVGVGVRYGLDDPGSTSVSLSETDWSPPSSGRGKRKPRRDHRLPCSGRR